MKKRFLGRAALLGAVAVIGICFGCSSSGAPRKARESWLPDTKGNLRMTNSSGKNSDIFVNDVYLHTIEKGKSNFLLDVTDARDPIGTEVLVKIYDREAVGSLDSPKGMDSHGLFQNSGNINLRYLNLLLIPQGWRGFSSKTASRI